MFRRSIRRRIYFLIVSTFISSMFTGIYSITDENKRDIMKLQKKYEWLNSNY